MANKRVGKRTVKLQNNPTIISAASVVGPKEGQGPLKEYFNLILQDDLYGEKFMGIAESKNGSNCYATWQHKKVVKN